jgi:hypothetical protein
MTDLHFTIRACSFLDSSSSLFLNIHGFHSMPARDRESRLNNLVFFFCNSSGGQLPCLTHVSMATWISFLFSNSNTQSWILRKKKFKERASICQTSGRHLPNKLAFCFCFFFLSFSL